MLAQKYISRYPVVFFFLCCSLLNAQSHTRKIYSLQDINTQAIDQDTLVVWDLHYTLVEPTPEEFWHGTYDRHQDKIDQHFLSPWVKKGLGGLLLDYLTLTVEWKILDAKTSDVLSKIWQKGAEQIAISKMKPGPLGDITDATQRTLDQLKPLALKPITDTLGVDINGNSYRKKDHILFVKTGSKVDALVEWLQTQQRSIKYLIFIDDSPTEVEAFANLAKLLKISYQAYWFKGKKLSKPQAHFDWKVIKNRWQEHMKKAEIALSLDATWHK